MLHEHIDLTPEEANALDAILGYIVNGAEFKISELRDSPYPVAIRRKLNSKAGLGGRVMET